MAFSTVPTKNVGDVFTAAMWNTYIRDNINKGVVRPIGDTVLGSAAASITFSSITTDYLHLMLLFHGRGDTVAVNTTLLLRLNGDTGTNYHMESARAVNTVVDAPTISGTSVQVGLVAAASATAGYASALSSHIMNYASTTFHKQLTFLNMHAQSAGLGNVEARFGGGFWASTAAVNSVQIFPGAGNFIAGTRATLYGMPG